MCQLNEGQILKVAKLMLEADSESALMPAGLSYIGQMISHDIVPPTSKNSASRHVTPFLNLDSLYGNDPDYLFQLQPEKTAFLDKDGKFNPRPITKPSKRNIILGYDVPRIEVNHQGQLHFLANIPESRNDENMIVCQLHAFWLAFHDWLIESGCVLHPLDAKKTVIQIFQLIVIEEFLQEILHPKVFHAYFRRNERYFPVNIEEGIPAFFSHAAFRIGHSLIRETYHIKDMLDIEVSLKNLFKRGAKVHHSKAINWRIFFRDHQSSQQPQFQPAKRIDTKISGGMATVEDPITRFITDVVKNNILAGYAADLPTGHVFRKKLKQANPHKDLAFDLGLVKLKDLSLTAFKDCQELTSKNLPLWLYILAEAEQETEHNSGNPYHLGALGSVLVAEVMRSSIESAEVSVFRNQQYKVEEALNRVECIKHGAITLADPSKVVITDIINTLHPV